MCLKRLKMMIRIFAMMLFCLFLNASPSLAALSAKKIAMQNGAALLLLENHSLPMVQMELLVRAGSILDPSPKAGLAWLTANLLEEGTETRSSKQIADELDAIGTDFAVSPGSDYATFSMKLLKKDLDRGAGLFSDILLHPAFPEEEVLRGKNQLLGHLMDEKDDPESIADKAFENALFKEHPYHHSAEGDEASVKTISRDDLVRFYKTAYHSNGAILVLVGDLTESGAKTLFEKYFGSWKPAPSVPSKNPLPAKIGKKETILIDKDLTQTSVIFGNIGINRNNPDYYPLQVMNYILGGGGFSSRMLANIRDNKGLVYSLDSHFYPSFETGSFKVILQTKNSSANQAIDEALKEIRKIQADPVTPDELQEAKDYLVGSFPLKMDTNSKLAGMLIYQEFYGLGLDYYETYSRQIKSVSVQDVQRVARQYLDPDHFLLVAVGKLSEANIPLADVKLPDTLSKEPEPSKNHAHH